jgi:hypothetical protein
MDKKQYIAQLEAIGWKIQTTNSKFVFLHKGMCSISVAETVVFIVADKHTQTNILTTYTALKDATVCPVGLMSGRIRHIADFMNPTLKIPK